MKDLERYYNSKFMNFSTEYREISENLDNLRIEDSNNSWITNSSSLHKDELEFESLIEGINLKRKKSQWYTVEQIEKLKLAINAFSNKATAIRSRLRLRISYTSFRRLMKEINDGSNNYRFKNRIRRSENELQDTHKEYIKQLLIPSTIPVTIDYV